MKSIISINFSGCIIESFLYHIVADSIPSIVGSFLPFLTKLLNSES